MKYPILLTIICIDTKTKEEFYSPAVLDLDINTIKRFYKSADNFVWVAYIDEPGYFKVAISFWEFIGKIKDKNNIDMTLEELVRMYDKDSLDDMLLNGI